VPAKLLAGFAARKLLSFGQELRAFRIAVNVAAKHPAPRNDLAIREDLDLRGLVCSIIHEYRETAASANRGVTFVDDHPYAIVHADRHGASLALRTILEVIARATPEPVIVVRLYATDEELCIDLSDSAVGPRESRGEFRTFARDSAPVELNLPGDGFEFARHRLEQSGAMLRAHRADAARIFTIAFERASN